MVFTRQCENCGQPDKIVKPCRACLRKCCNECSHDKLCLDCWLLKNTKREISIYWDEKTEMEV